MICNYELPVIEEVFSNNPFFKKTVAESQENFTSFGRGVSQAENGITRILGSGKKHSQDVLEMCNALDGVSDVIDNELYSTSLQKFSEGLIKIETYREMLLTQTQVLTLEPLKQVQEESFKLTTLQMEVSRLEEQVNTMLERCSSCKSCEVDSTLYTKLCDETVELRKEHYLKQLEYVRSLRANHTNTKLKFVQKFLEQMLAQFSFANFAYMVMREMEPYLTELFETLQSLQRINNEQLDTDNTGVSEAKEEIECWYNEEKRLTASLTPNAQQGKSSAFRNLLSFAVPESMIVSLENTFLSESDEEEAAQGSRVSPRGSPTEITANNSSTSPKTSPSSSPSLSDRSPSSQRKEFTPIPQTTPKSRSNPFNKKSEEVQEQLVEDFPQIITEDYSLISAGEIERDREAQSLGEIERDREALSHSTEYLTTEQPEPDEMRRAVSGVDLTTFHHDEDSRQRSKTDTVAKRRSQLIKLDSLQRMRKSDKKQGYLYVRQKSTLGYRWVLMYCVVEADFLKGWAQDKEDKMVELEHLPTTTVKPTGSERHLTNDIDNDFEVDFEINSPDINTKPISRERPTSSHIKRISKTTSALLTCLPDKPGEFKIDRNSCFYLVSPKGKRCYQAFTELDRRNWIRALTHSSVLALQRKNTLDGKHIDRLYNIPGNNQCADCADVNPEWACIDHGTTICIACSGVHRSLGVNVSKVRSIYLDNWSEQVLLHMESSGNTLFNALYEACDADKIDNTADKDERLAYIKRKYIDKVYHSTVTSEAVTDPTDVIHTVDEEFVTGLEDVIPDIDNSDDCARERTSNIKSEQNSEQSSET